MKKIKSLLLAIFTIAFACCMLLISGCSKSTTYKLQSIKVDDGTTTATISIGDKYEGVELKEDTIILILEEDNYVLRFHRPEDTSGISSSSEEMETLVTCGKWVKGYNDEIYLDTKYGTAIIGKIDGDSLILAIEDEETVVLVKD